MFFFYFSCNKSHSSPNDLQLFTVSCSGLPFFLSSPTLTQCFPNLLRHQTAQCWSESEFISGDVSPAGVFWARFKNPVNTFWRNHETLIQLINETSLFCFPNSVSPMLLSSPLSLTAIHALFRYLCQSWVRHSAPPRGSHRVSFHLNPLLFKRPTQNYKMSAFFFFHELHEMPYCLIIRAQ